jgi:Domain of unknown function (DUF1833)
MVATPQYAEPAQRVLASAPELQAPLWGITLTHPLFTAGNGVGAEGETEHWLINRPAAMDLTLEDDTVQEYLPSHFEIVLPKMDGAGQQDAQVSLQNVDRIIVDELELANADPSERIQVTVRLFLEDDPTAGPQNVPLRLSFSQVHATSQVVTGTAGRPDVLNRPFPLEVYRIDRWPGLDR